MVINHPIWTAPGSTPIEEPEGEILWRTGTYFGRGFSDEPAGKGKVRFYHRTHGGPYELRLGRWLGSSAA